MVILFKVDLFESFFFGCCWTYWIEGRSVVFGMVQSVSGEKSFFEAPMNTHPLRVLLADFDTNGEFTVDEKSNVEIQGFIESAELGCSVFVVRDSQELFLSLTEQHFDGVILACRMGENELAQVIQRIHSVHAALPIIVLGEDESPKAAVRALRAGAFDYLIRRATSSEELMGAIHDSLLSRQLSAVDEARRTAEKVLRERELQIRGFFDFASAAMALLGPHGNIIRANPALRKLCGYELQEITRLTLLQLIFPEDKKIVSECLSSLKSLQVEVCDEEVQFCHKSGEGIWVSVSFAMITDEDGEVQGYTLHATDIRTRKATEAELQRSERRFQELLAQAPIGIFETSVSGSCRYVNDKWSEVTGLSYTEAIGLGWSQTIHPDDRKKVLEEWQSAVENEGEFSGEFRFQRPDGEIIWVSGKSGATRDHEGKLMGYLGTVTDITDQHRAEEDLRRTGALLRGVLDSTPYSVIVTSIDGRVREINRGASELLGYSVLEVIGTLAVDLIHDREEVENRVQGLADALEQPILIGMPALAELTGARGSCEWTYIKKGGEAFPVELAVSEMRDLEGRLYGYVAVANDITERVRRSKELVSAKDEAERASAAKADFLARMSHEIRTPMNSVLGMTEIALQTKLTTEQRGYLELVHGSGQRLLRLINDILDFSRGEARELTLDHISFDLHKTFALCLRGLSHRAREKGVELVLRVAPDTPPRVVGDPHRLQQIVVNLVGNAVKFTSTGEVVVDVACAFVESSERLVLSLDVYDTGPGVAKEEQERIFRAFTQEDKGIARRYGGTGLGLAICSQLVELMDGAIWLDSELGCGSCFHVRLNLERAEQPLHEPHLSRIGQVENKHLLILEPNEKSREVTRLMLQKCGYSVVCVANYTEAIEQIERFRDEGKHFSAAILDLLDWGPCGYQFVSDLKQMNGPIGIVCLSPTNHGDEDRWTEGYANLVKPILPGELQVALHEIFVPQLPRKNVAESQRRFIPEKTRSLKILVAEDNTTNQQVVYTMLERLGHETILVASGQAALEKLANQDFDLVLMDLQMPVMGGLEAVLSLREKEKLTGKHTPVVALTAQAMQGDREACLRSGMDDYLSKPLDMNSLSRVLKSQTSLLAKNEQLEEADPVCTPSPLGRVDFVALRRRIGESRAALATIYELFERDSTQLLRVLQEQLEEGIFEDSTEAHTLKGMLRNVCAGETAELTARLEVLTQEGNWRIAREHLTRLEKEVRAVARELQCESRSSSSPPT